MKLTNKTQIITGALALGAISMLGVAAQAAPDNRDRNRQQNNGNHARPTTQNKPVVQNRPVVVNQRPVVVNQRPVVVNQRPVVINRRPVVVNQRPVIVDRRPTVVVNNNHRDWHNGDHRNYDNHRGSGVGVYFSFGAPSWGTRYYSGPGYRYDPALTIDHTPATVLQLDYSGNWIEIQADGGAIYDVHVGNAHDYWRGERIAVQGEAYGSTIQATDINRL